MKAKFKVGDKVVMVNPEAAESHYAPTEEFPAIGEVTEVHLANKGENGDWESVFVKGSSYYWSVEALELYKE